MIPLTLLTMLRDGLEHGWWHILPWPIWGQVWLVWEKGSGDDLWLED